MRVRLYEDIIVAEGFSSIIINKRINLNEEVLQSLILNCKNVDKEDLLQTLNSINNQGLLNIDLNKFTFNNYAGELNLNNLCSAEKIFLLAYLGTKENQMVWFLDDCLSLEEETLKLFMKIFKYSDYVGILTKAEVLVSDYEEMIENV